jgi:phosphotransferase system enzyme I (PtsI)
LDKIEPELIRFEEALSRTRKQIQELQQRIAQSVGDENASIFDAHLLVVEDRSLIDEVVRTIRKERFNAETVFTNVSARYIKTLAEIDDPYLRERAVDIHDVCRRVVRNLSGGASRDLGSDAGGTEDTYRRQPGAK